MVAAYIFNSEAYCFSTLAWTIPSQMEVIGPASNWLLILRWWLAVPLAQPKLAAKFDIGWKPGYQDTILFLALSLSHIISLIQKSATC